MSKEEKYTPIESEACLKIEAHFWDEGLLSPVYTHWAPFQASQTSSKVNLPLRLSEEDSLTDAINSSSEVK